MNTHKSRDVLPYAEWATFYKTRPRHSVPAARCGFRGSERPRHVHVRLAVLVRPVAVAEHRVLQVLQRLLRVLRREEQLVRELREVLRRVPFECRF